MRAKKRKLVKEMFGEVEVSSDPNISIVFDNMVSEWGALPYAELSVLLVHLRYLNIMHHSHHWTCKGDSFYGDHQLFQRLYEATESEIDSIGERAVGLGMTDNVNLFLQNAQLQRLTEGYNMLSTIPQSTELAHRSLAAEKNFLVFVALAAERLREQGLLSRGLDNMLQGIEDQHETHVYLLKQRTT